MSETLENVWKTIREAPLWQKILGGIGVLILIGAIAGGGSEEPNSKSGDDGKQKASGGGEEKQSFEATDDNTPHVAAPGPVKVDGVIYRITSAKTSKQIGDQYTGEAAAGVFLTLTVKAKSVRKSTGTLSGDTIKLEAGETTYDADKEGSTAALLSGGASQPFFLEDIQPGTTTSGVIVFDIPPDLLNKKVEARFNELGFGPTHGYIRIPATTPG